MASLDLVRHHLVATVTVVGLLVGGVIGLFLPIRAASPPKAGNEAWNLPSIADSKRFREEAYSAVRAGRFWNTVQGPGGRSAPKVEWSLVAIITRPRPMAAIGQTAAKQSGTQGSIPASNLVAVGAKLPDGSTLVRLTRDAIWFEKDGCLRERRLYRAVTAENNACLGEATSGTADVVGAATAKATSSQSPTQSSSQSQLPLPAPAPVARPAAPSPQSGANPVRPASSVRPAAQAAGAATQ